MFRISQFMRLLAAADRGEPLPPARRVRPPGPVVIWNLIRRCNLACTHCYALSADHDYPGELGTDEAFAVLDDLKAFRVPMLILSGGEPLLRPDLFAIAARAKALGIAVGLSTNGTLIDGAVADRIAATGFDYVGISLDGLRAGHDRFRHRQGAFDLSLAALRHLRARGVKLGLRFTLTAANALDLPPLLDLMHSESVPKFYLSHLNYAGRGNLHRAKDAHFAATRAALDLLYDRAWNAALEGRAEEYVSGNNDADGPWLLHWLARRNPDLHARVGEALRDHLVAWGGNASGLHVANIDNLGEVHPDTMWWHHRLGSVRARPFSAIWTDLADPVLAGLKRQPRAVQGRCAECRHLDICGGNTRVRADQVSGNPWGEDPGCYLDDAEIGVAPGGVRVATTPFASRRQTAAAEAKR